MLNTAALTSAGFALLSAAWSGVAEPTLSCTGKHLDSRRAADARNAGYANDLRICTGP